MKLQEGVSYLIVGDSCYRQLVLDVLSEHPSLDMTFLSCEEAFQAAGYTYRKDPLPFLLSKGLYSYSDAKQLMSLLTYVRLEEGDALFSLRQELIRQGYLAVDKISRYQLSTRKVLLLEEEDDRALKALLSREGISFSLLSLDDLGLRRRPAAPDIFLFPDKVHQFSYLFSDLRKRILDGEREEDFTILVHDDQDRYFLQLFSSLFGLSVTVGYRYPLLADKDVRRRMEESYARRSFALEDVSTPAEKRLAKRLLYYGLPQLDFDYAFSRAMEIVKSESFTDEQEFALKATTSLSFSLRKRYYVTNFQHGDFYQIGSDRGLFSDEALARMGANPSYVETLRDKRRKANFLCYMDVLFFSRVELHLSDKIFPSELLQELPLPEGWSTLREVKKTVNEAGSYPRKAKEFVLALDKDRFFQPKDDVFRSYDPSFQGIEVPPSDRTFHVTSLSKYFSCPYAYYLDYVRKVGEGDVDRDDFFQRFGTFVHALFERIYEPDYDFEEEYRTARERFEKDFPPEADLVTRQMHLSWLENAKGYLSRFVFQARTQFQDKDTFLGEEAERSIRLTLRSEETANEYQLKGRIDKLLYTKANGRVFYSILDYKTGAERFDYRSVFLGGSLQLPLYYAAVQDAMGEAQFGLFGIEHIFKKTPLLDDDRSFSTDAVGKYMRVRGVSFDDKDFLLSFDDEKAFTSKGEIARYGGSYLSRSLAFVHPEEDFLRKDVPYRFDTLIEDAKKAAAKTMDGIREGRFPIAPVVLSAKEKPACAYCSYRDVCYRSPEAIVNLQPKVVGRFGTGSEEETEESA